MPRSHGETMWGVPADCLTKVSANSHHQPADACVTKPSHLSPVPSRVTPPPKGLCALTPGACECYPLHGKRTADGIKGVRLDGKNRLDDPGGPSLVTCTHASKEAFPAGWRAQQRDQQRGATGEEANEIESMTGAGRLQVALEIEEQSYKPRNAGSL